MSWLFGRLTWDDIIFISAWHEGTTSAVIGASAGGLVVLAALALLVLLIVTGWLDIPLERMAHQPRPQENRQSCTWSSRWSCSPAL